MKSTKFPVDYSSLLFTSFFMIVFLMSKRWLLFHCCVLLSGSIAILTSRHFADFTSQQLISVVCACCRITGGQWPFLTAFSMSSGVGMDSVDLFAETDGGSLSVYVQLQICAVRGAEKSSFQ